MAPIGIFIARCLRSECSAGIPLECMRSSLSIPVAGIVAFQCLLYMPHSQEIFVSASHHSNPLTDPASCCARGMCSNHHDTDVLLDGCCLHWAKPSEGLEPEVVAGLKHTGLF